MEQVIDQILSDLRRDPHALESVWFSQIVFAAKAVTLSPLQDIINFRPGSLPIGGGTGVGAMLEHLMKTLKSDIQVDTSTGKADWKPIVYLMTDGRSTDSTVQAIQDWNRNFKGKCLLVAISLGTKSDISMLRQLTDNVVVFMDTSPQAYSSYAEWISRSISESIKVASSPVHASESPIAKFEEGLIENGSSGNSSHAHDEDAIVLVGRCQNSKKPYLLRYSTEGVSGGSKFAGIVALKETYFELSANQSQNAQVDVQYLENPGRCIHCASETAFVLCSGCSKLSCGSSDSTWCCPWCGLSGELGPFNGSAYTDRSLG